MYVDQRQAQLILDLANRKLTAEEFIKQFPLEGLDPRVAGQAILTQASVSHDANAVEYGLILGYYFGFNERYIEVLRLLAQEDWHYKHEDIASAMAVLKSTDCIDALFRLTLKNFPYLDYDESFSLARKCIWALGKIGTVESVEKICLLAGSGNDTIKKYARRQLQHIVNEDLPEVVKKVALDALSALQNTNG